MKLKTFSEVLNESQRITHDYLTSFNKEYVIGQDKYNKNKRWYIQPTDDNEKFKVIQTVEGSIKGEDLLDFNSVQEIISKDFKGKGNGIKHYDLLEKYGFSLI